MTNVRYENNARRPHDFEFGDLSIEEVSAYNEGYIDNNNIETIHSIESGPDMAREENSLPPSKVYFF